MPQTRRFVRDSGRFLALLAVIVLGVLTTVGSGGGGGGGSSSGPTPLTYTGVTTQATVNSSNAQILAAAALQGGGAGTTAVTGAMESSDTATLSGEPRIVGIVNLLKGSLGRTDFGFAGGATATAAVYSTTVPSPYGSGNLVLSFDYIGPDGSFNGTASYNNYCENADSCVNGNSDFSGQLNTATYALNWIEFNFILLSGTENGIPFQMSGGMNLTMLSSISTQALMSFVIADSSGTYKIDNYIFFITDYMTYAEVSIPSGRFYHATYGYVDVTTPASLRYNVTNTVNGLVVANWPYQGEFEIDGAVNSKALLTALSDDISVTPQWQLQLDDGGGVLMPLSSGDWVDL